MFARIWAWILSVLMFLFPFFFKPPVTPPTKLDVNASVEIVINAIKTGDIAAIEAFMCKNIKDNVPNLQTEIGNLIDLIEGEITSTSSTSVNDFYMTSGGKTIERAISNSYINTAVANYKLDIRWEIYNNFSLAERGIRRIGLYITVGDAYELLIDIRATDA